MRRYGEEIRRCFDIPQRGMQGMPLVSPLPRRMQTRARAYNRRHSIAQPLLRMLQEILRSLLSKDGRDCDQTSKAVQITKCTRKWVMFLSENSQISLPYLIRSKQIIPDRLSKNLSGLVLFCSVNWNLVVLQLLNLIGNHSHGFCIGINFNGTQCLIHRYSCYASLNYIF